MLPHYEENYNKNQKNIITVGLSQNITLTTEGEQKVNLNQIKSQVGNKLTFEDGKVIIGKGISKVLINASLCFNFAEIRTTMAYNLYIFKNGNIPIYDSLNSSSEILNNTNRTLSTPNLLLDVSENDYFELKTYASKDDIISSYNNRTIMTIEAVE